MRLSLPVWDDERYWFILAPRVSERIQMTVERPKVSIGLPVYNGERYLAAALDGILRQTFEDFEIVISDNASTDRTREICSEYCKKDGRIRYSRNDTNIGSARNFNRVFELSRGS